MSRNKAAFGLERFEFYLQQVQGLLTLAAGTANPCLSLYENNARTPMFMLEALSRMYEKLHDAKAFGKLKEDFKLLEDLLGKIDYYDAFCKEFSAEKQVPQSIIKWLKLNKESATASLNAMLLERNWIGNDDKRLEKIRKKLDEASWMQEKEERSAVKKQYEKFIEDIIDDVSGTGIHFKDVEADVHELRRKLRWLSIYPQCFRGLFQLKMTGEPSGAQEKYLTREIVESPYNRMPIQNTDYAIYLDANAFYALSWMIAELGKLKDSGLKAHILREAVLATTGSSEKQALARAAELAGKDQMPITSILNKAEQETIGFFKEHILNSLVV